MKLSNPSASPETLVARPSGASNRNLLLIATAFAFASQLSAQSLLNDQFTGSGVSAANWTSSSPFSDSAVSVGAGILSLSNGGGILSVSGYSTPIEVAFAFAFTGGAYDSFRVYSRAGQFNSNGYGVKGVGVSFRIQEDAGNLNGNIALEDNGAVLATGTVPLAQNTYYTVRLVDTGNSLSLFWNSSASPLITATTASVYGNKIAAFNREGAGHGSFISAGSVSALDYLTVTALPVPVITAITASRQVVNLGQNLALNVTATSNTAITYQWKHNGLPISGATAATYNITNASLVRDGGWYQVVVANGSGGATTSAVIFVNVVTNPAQVLGLGDNSGGGITVPTSLTSVATIVSGQYHTLAVTGDGNVIAWGDSLHVNGAANVPAGLVNVVGVSAGSFHSLALKSDGTLVVWGSYGAGDGAVPASLSNVVSISSGAYHNLALRSDGTVVAWGVGNSMGQTTLPSGLSSVVAVAAGGLHSLALRSDGTVVAWGSNIYGESNVPNGLSNVIAIAASNTISLALKRDGTVVEWGSVQQTVLNIAGIFGAADHALLLKADGTAVLGTSLPIESGGPVVGLAGGVGFTIMWRDASNDSAPTITTQPVAQVAYLGQRVTFTVEARSGAAALSYQWRKDGANISGATNATYSVSPVVSGANGTYDVVVSDYLGTVASSAALLSINPAPFITSQPGSLSVTSGQSAILSVSATGSPTPTFQWQLNGSGLSGATSPTFALANIQSDSAGLYTTVMTNSAGSTTSDPAIVGVLTMAKVIGTGEEIAANIPHPNGNTFDQVLLKGVAETITADAGQVTRTSFIDLNDDIVQVEFSGAGTLSLVLDNPTGPAAPINYTQPTVAYMKGHAGIVITGANETTNVSVFSVGRVNANDPTGAFNILQPASATNDPANNGSPLFQGHATTAYDGVADIAYIAIASTNGKFGGLRASDASCFATKGLTGIYAPGVQFTGPVFISDIHASAAATPVLIIGSSPDTRITGGALSQANGQPVKVSGLTQLKFTAGGTSNNVSLPAQTNKAVLQQNGVDVTAQVVVNPSL